MNFVATTTTTTYTPENMAACGSLQHIFDNPLDPPPPLSSCKHISPPKPLDNSPTDVFSGFNLNDRTDSMLSSPDHNSECLSEALGFESFDDVEEDFNSQWERQRHEHTIKNAKGGVWGEPKRSRISGKEIPPPISTIGRRACFKSYRYNGRLVLKEEKIPTQEILHAFREDGRLKLQFVRFNDEVDRGRKNDNGDNTEENEIRKESP